jgi:outer membrane lipoprotein-sorting protein
MRVILSFEDSVNHRHTIAFLLCVAAASCFCQQGTLLDRIKANYSGQTPLSASFDVHILWKVREKEETRHGSIVLAPGDRFRIQLGSGLWVSNGKTLWQYDQTLGQVVIKQLTSADNALLPSQAVSRYCSSYPLAAKAAQGTNAVFEWKADTASAGQNAEVLLVRIVADQKTGAIVRLFVIDKTGNESTYSFAKTALGKAAPAKTFEFDVPKGARVLDQR